MPENTKPALQGLSCRCLNTPSGALILAARGCLPRRAFLPVKGFLPGGLVCGYGGCLLDEAAVGGAGVVVGGASVGEFVFFDVAFFLGPALVDAFEAPFGAAFVTDRFAIDEDEDGVGVG